jgi:hypothetical protein
MQEDCVHSTYYKDRNGYSLLRIAGKLEYHHRVSFAAANNMSMEELRGKWILHSCDNPACINPAHLRIGTPADNTADMMSRKRNGYDAKPGSRNPGAKLTEDLVRAIRAERLTQVEIAKKYGITQANVSSIHLRKTWTHI